MRGGGGRKITDPTFLALLDECGSLGNHDNVMEPFDFEATLKDLDKTALAVAGKLKLFTQYSNRFIGYEESGIRVYMAENEAGIRFNHRHKASPVNNNNNNQNELEEFLSEKACASCFSDKNSITTEEETALTLLHTKALLSEEVSDLKRILLFLHKNHAVYILREQTILSAQKTFYCKEYTKTSRSTATITCIFYPIYEHTNPSYDEIYLKIDTTATKTKKQGVL
jgi:hypothetical protein